MRRIIVTAGLIGLAAVSAARAQQPAASPTPAPPPASGGPHFGLQAALALDGGDFGFGGRLSYPFRMAGNGKLAASAYVNWFPGNVNVFDINWDLQMRFKPSGVRPYLAAGANFVIVTGNGNSNSDFGLNAVGGLEFSRMGKLSPFLEGRYSFFSFEDLVITAGVHF